MSLKIVLIDVIIVLSPSRFPLIADAWAPTFPVDDMTLLNEKRSKRIAFMNSATSETSMLVSPSLPRPEAALNMPLRALVISLTFEMSYLSAMPYKPPLMENLLVTVNLSVTLAS